MNRKRNMFNLMLLLLAILSVSLISKGTDKYTGQKFYKTSALDPQRTLSNINNWAYWMYADGQAGITVSGQGGGFFPRGTDHTIFQDGFVWGAKVNGDVKVGGQTYSIGTVSALSDRIYRIRSDWASLTLNSVREDAAEFYEKSAESISEAEANDLIEQYKKDWAEWPVEEGAPYVDVNDNGIYDPVLDGDNMPDPLLGDYPGIANADQVVYLEVDDSDNSVATALYGSGTMGITLQITAWGYNQKAATLGQMIFKKYKIINTSDDVFEDMYVAQWCDPDLGDASDDLVGCDTTLSLGFAYNGGPSDGNYDDFGIAPPAFGYDFFQGPIVDGAPTDTAVFDLKKVPGKKNLPMTSFAYYSAGNVEWGDPALQDYDGTLEWYNILRGNISKTDVDNPISFKNRNTDEETNFPLAGDPVTNTGDVDGQGANFPPADRRMSVNTGPFTMQPGDVQEVVVAIVGGHSPTDYLQSITQLKNNDQLAQQLYDDLFKTIPKPPPTPSVDVTALENKIVLNWGEDPVKVSATEDTYFADSDSTGYAFEGYNVWQLEFGLKPKQKLIATYDVINDVTTIEQEVFIEQFGTIEVVPVRFGSNSGLKRHFIVEKDYINNVDLVPGNIYYFAVSAYNYNSQPNLISDLSLESSVIPLQVQTTAVDPDLKLNSKPNDEIIITKTAGLSDGQVLVKVVDPTKVTGDNYEIFFTNDADSNSATFGQVLWNVRNTSTAKVVVSNQLQSADLDVSDQPVFEGLTAVVAGPKLVVKDWDWSDGDVSPLYPDYDDGRWISAASDWGGGALFGSLGMAGIFWNGVTGTEGVAAADYKNVELRFAHMLTYDDTTGDGLFSFDAGGSEPHTWDPAKGQGAFMYSTWGGGNYLGFNQIPFQAWDVEDPDNPRQLNVVIRDRDTNGFWDPGTGAGPFNYVWIMSDDYDPTGTAWDGTTGRDFMAELLSDPVPAYYVLWAGPRGSREWMAEDGVLTIYPARVNLPADVFSFTAPAVNVSVDNEEEAAKKVTVFPNPYYAGNTQETNILGKFVTFYHLPTQSPTTIRIFNLAGDHVAKLEKDPATNNTQFFRWNLQNNDGVPVASGIYFARIEMTLSNGKKITKVLKVFVIQRQQQLKYF